MLIQPLLFTAIVLIRDVQLADMDLGGLVKQTVAGNEAVLHNCSKDQDQVLQQCYLDMFLSYDLNATQLPSASSDPFRLVRLDASGMCTSYATLRHCHSDVIKDCLNYNTFNSLFSSEIDAAYYVSQTAFLEFYCDYSKEFVSYYECLQAIEMNDLSDTIYTECSVLEVGSCESVSRTTQCERAVVRKSCGKTGVHSYCQYQKILTHMTGWNFCEYMPCINSSNSTSVYLSLIFLLFFLISTLH